EIKRAGAIAEASATPAKARYLSKLAIEAGADIFVVQSTVTSARHISSNKEELNIRDLCCSLPVPVMVGNCVSYRACLALLETGASGILVGRCRQHLPSCTGNRCTPDYSYHGLRRCQGRLPPENR
ncbi:MAG: tRNA-dihydrouridine synthase, partial [Dehalococcoidales bacterium]|nr:tRNA-dihydrouridine synthase [Dehalococcoidales bacterium]